MTLKALVEHWTNRLAEIVPRMEAILAVAERLERERDEARAQMRAAVKLADEMQALVGTTQAQLRALMDHHQLVIDRLEARLPPGRTLEEELGLGFTTRDERDEGEELR